MNDSALMSKISKMSKKPRQSVESNLKEGLFQDCEVAAFESNLGWTVVVRHDFLLVRLSFGYRSQAAAIKAVEPFIFCTATNDSLSRKPLNKKCVVCDHDRHRAGHPLVEDWPDRLVRRLRAFADGSPEAFDDVSLDLTGATSFQRKVVARCRSIGFGQVLTYGQLATQAGHRGAARAVGQVMAHNRFPLVVPCHRVIGSSGRLVGFTSPDGIHMKRRLLQNEGIDV